MAHKELVLVLSMIVAASPVSAMSQDPAPMIGAPAGTPETRYCMRIEPITGSRLEELKCWTREEWAENGVDVGSHALFVSDQLMSETDDLRDERLDEGFVEGTLTNRHREVGFGGGACGFQRLDRLLTGVEDGRHLRRPAVVRRDRTSWRGRPPMAMQNRR